MNMTLLAARLSMGAAIAFLALLASLHVLEPELDPSWHFISEYAIGDLGWMMTLAFLALAVSSASLAVALRSEARTIGGRIGLGLLGITAIGMAIAGIFPTDAITTSRAAMTSNGKLHEIGGFLDLTPFAALLIGWSLAKRNEAWGPAKAIIGWTAGLPLLGLVVFGASTAVLAPEGKFGPGVSIGWPNRFLILTYCIWFITVAGATLKLRR